MKRLLAHLAKGAMLMIYVFIKMVTKVDHRKVVFLGRRMDQVPLDFRLLMTELKNQHPEVKATVLSSKYRGGFKETIKFAPVLLKSLYHLATAKVCVLDSYWPAVSALPHHSDLVVYQLWHSLGKIKQSGLQTLGRAHGRDQEAAGVLQMHQGYDYVLAGAEIWNPKYVESFGIEEEQILNYGLPRSDYLINERETTAERIRRRYPTLADKPVVLYAPTLRRGIDAEGALHLAAAIDSSKFTLIIKMHGSDTMLIPSSGFLDVPQFSATELLTVTDYLITDYSSIALEAAILDVKTLYYVYDEEDYLLHNGMNIDLHQEMPGCVFTTEEQLIEALERDYPVQKLEAYKEKFILNDLGHSTSDLAEHILSVGELCSR